MQCLFQFSIMFMFPNVNLDISDDMSDEEIMSYTETIEKEKEIVTNPPEFRPQKTECSHTIKPLDASKRHHILVKCQRSLSTSGHANEQSISSYNSRPSVKKVEQLLQHSLKCFSLCRSEFSSTVVHVSVTPARILPQTPALWPSQMLLP